LGEERGEGEGMEKGGRREGEGAQEGGGGGAKRRERVMGEGHVKKLKSKIKKIYYGFKIVEIFFLEFFCHEVFAKQKKEKKNALIQLVSENGEQKE
jgi:hypothetical protein